MQEPQKSRKKAIVKEPDLDHGIKTQFVYAATIDAGQIYTDQTGRFPVVSSKGNRYIMILYDYDSRLRTNTWGRNARSAPVYLFFTGFGRVWNIAQTHIHHFIA
jgi:hypothetical protein